MKKDCFDVFMNIHRRRIELLEENHGGICSGWRGSTPRGFDAETRNAQLTGHGERT